MQCPFCLSPESKVTDKRTCNETIRRRRQCVKCKKRFTTYEKIELTNLLVEKKDGRKEYYNREKLLKGVARACNKRPVTQDQINNLVDKIEAEIRRKTLEVINSKFIGNLVMKYLNRLDKVAYMRFASVYREFNSLEAFKEE